MKKAILIASLTFLIWSLYYGQSDEIKRVEFFIDLSNKSNKNAYKKAFYDKHMHDDEVIRYTEEPAEILNYLHTMYQDSLANVRSMAYAICGQLAKFNLPKRTKALKKEVAIIQLKGSKDLDPYIRKQCIARLTTVNSPILTIDVGNDPDVVSGILDYINSYPDEVSKGLIRLIGKFKIQSLKEEIRSYFTEKGIFYNNSYEHLKWDVNVTLARLGDSSAIFYTIELLRTEANLNRKYKEAAFLANYIGGMYYAKFIYELYMSAEGENRMEPLGRGETFSETYIGRYLRPQTIFTNPMTEEEKAQINEALEMDISTDELLFQQENKIMNVTRAWLTRTKDDWTIISGNK